MQNTVSTTTGRTAPLDIEQGQTTRPSNNESSGLKAACSALASVLFAVGAGVCILNGIQQGKKPECSPANQSAGFPCPEPEPSMGLLAGGFVLALASMATGCGAINLCLGRPFGEGMNHTSGRARHGSSFTSWNMTTMPSGTMGHTSGL